MGLLKKAATFTVLTVEGLKNLTPVQIETALSKSRIKDIKGSADFEAFGFCKINDPFEFSIAYSNSVLGFGLRHDKKKISKGLFKKLYKSELRELVSSKSTGKKRKRLSKEEKQYAKEEVLARLYAEAQPIEKVTEVILNFKDDLAFLGTTNAHVVDGFCDCLKDAIPDSQVSVWCPEVIDNETKGTKENYQNALLTWILNKSVSEMNRGWTALSAKFYDGVSTISLTSDQELPAEAWFSSYKDRVVDALSFSIKDKEQEVDVSMNRGSWCLKKVKFKPEISHEDVESALFERYSNLLSTVTQVRKVVEEFGSIRGTKKEETFWEQVHEDAKEKIKSEVEA